MGKVSASELIRALQRGSKRSLLGRTWAHSENSAPVNIHRRTVFRLFVEIADPTMGAAARRLAIDLWRLATGRATLKNFVCNSPIQRLKNRPLKCWNKQPIWERRVYEFSVGPLK
jgi:hypothetical protein